MGAYINPNGQSKEDFLISQAAGLISEDEAIKHKPGDGGMYAVVLIDNFLFTAAGILFDQDEIRAATMPDDRRPKRYYLVSVDRLLSVSNLASYIDAGRV